MGVKLQSLNAARAMMYGKRLTPTEMVIMSRSYWTHSELQFSNRYENISWSSTRKGGYDCVRFLDIKYSHPERWDTVVIPVPDDEEDKLYAYCSSLEGVEYDLWGLLGFTTKLNIIKEHPDKMWCSEACCKALCEVRDELVVELGKLELPQELSPEQLHLIASNIWNKN